MILSRITSVEVNESYSALNGISQHLHPAGTLTMGSLSSAHARCLCVQNFSLLVCVACVCMCVYTSVTASVSVCVHVV